MKLFEPSIARAARAYTGLTHIELAKAANVASRTIYRLEKDGNVTQETLDRILLALKVHGVATISDESGRVSGLAFNDLVQR